jgi:hypothetical protein
VVSKIIPVRTVGQKKRTKKKERKIGNIQSKKGPMSIIKKEESSVEYGWAMNDLDC